MKRLVLVGICAAAALLFTLPAQAVEVSGGGILFFDGPSTSITGTISQPVWSPGSVEVSVNGWFLATPGDPSQMALGVSAKMQTLKNLELGLAYAHARNTTEWPELLWKNTGISALWNMAALTKPAALAPGELPDQEIKVGLLENGLVGARWRRRF